VRTQHETAFSVLTQLDPLAGYRHTSIHDAEDEAGTEEEIARIIATPRPRLRTAWQAGGIARRAGAPRQRRSPCGAIGLAASAAAAVIAALLWASPSAGAPPVGANRTVSVMAHLHQAQAAPRS
jgi:hypothetical protein